MTAPRTTGQLGRKPNAGRPRIRLTTDHVPAAYTPPATLDRWSAIPAGTIGMDGNDAVGDCTCADVDHEVKSVQVAAGNPEVASTAAEVLAAYSAITGYNPADPSSDQGAEMQAVREYWQKTGFALGGQVHQVLLFAELDIHNDNLVKWALDQIGAVGIGVNFPRSAMDQFNADQPWDVVSDDGGIEGGHAVAVVGYDATYWYVITWGQVQKVTPAWFRAYVEEAWVSLAADFVNAHSGEDPLGGTLFDLGAQFSALTGQPNPVAPPVPAPTPVPPVPSPSPVPVPSPPAPTPSPSPAPDAADMALVATLGPWSREHHIGRNEVAARAFQSWRVAKGL